MSGIPFTPVSLHSSAKNRFSSPLKHLSWVIYCLSFALVACGGGGSGTPPSTTNPPASTNQPDTNTQNPSTQNPAAIQQAVTGTLTNAQSQPISSMRIIGGKSPGCICDHASLIELKGKLKKAKRSRVPWSKQLRAIDRWYPPLTPRIYAKIRAFPIGSGQFTLAKSALAYGACHVSQRFHSAV